MDNTLTSRSARLVVWPEITSFLLIIMEISWLLPWYRGVIEISYVASELRAGLVLAGMMLAAYLLTRLFDSLRLITNVQHVLLVLVFVINVSLSARLLLDPANPSLISGLIGLDPGAVLVAIVGLWLWWRGIGLARTMIGPVMVWGRFWFGMIMLVVYLLIIDRVTQTSPGFLPFFMFLLSGLLALVVGRVAFISLFHGSYKNPLGRSWLATIGLTVGGFVGLSMLFASLLTGQFSGLLQQLTVALRWLLVIIIFVASIPWLILSIFLFPLLAMIRDALPAPSLTPTPTPLMPYPDISPSLQPALPPLAQPTILPQTIVTVIFWSVVLLLVLIYFARARRENLRIRHQSYEDPESLLDRDALLRQMRNSLRQQARSALDGLAGRLRGRRYLAAQLVRQIYAQLLDLAQEINQPRPSSLTPLEFLPVLELAMPGLSAELGLITQAYVRVRYGEIPETQAEIESLKEAWVRIDAQGQQLKKQARQAARLAEFEHKEKQKKTEES
jgi:hypothetical protein